ncbi:30S ribosomal protein S3, partial [Pseudomonas sp. Fl4BN2]|nr:30S ribosomal protein S3 [Pseudomonas sp. Fl4BN2]
DAPVVEEPQEERRKRPGRPEGRRREGEGRPAGQRRGAGAGARRGTDAKTGE